MKFRRTITSLAFLAAAFLPPASLGDEPAPGVVLAEGGKAGVVIVLPEDAIPAEQTAARELAEYLNKATGAEFQTVVAAGEPGQRAIYLGRTAFARSHGLDAAGWRAEQWAVRSVVGGLILTGGRPRGTLYAVYRFLEDVVGVRWWNPFEEHVPVHRTLVVAGLDRRGEPRFRYRDIHLLYANDDGRFAARNRINALGFAPIGGRYGGAVYYGPPGGVHTFSHYVPPDPHFGKHPEWFSMIDGKRTAERAQLCLTNQDLQAFVRERLRGFVAQSAEQAQLAGRPAPLDFDISQNDWHRFCQCPQCHAIAQAEGSQTGPLLHFLNPIAEAIAKEYPDVRINTLAYGYYGSDEPATAEPARTVRPRENVIPRLCYTDANMLRPITHPDNRPFAERVAAWGRVARHLRIWDYAVTYSPYYGLPLPTVHTYAPDYRYYAQHHVEGIFTEHEYPILADTRDLKVWMMMKLKEDPDRDADVLLADFTNGFYGPAGAGVRRYLRELQAAAEASDSNVDWFPSLNQYAYLNWEFIHRAQELFDETERTVAGDPLLLRRLRHARLPLDRASLIFWPRLMEQWIADGGDPEQIPLDRDAVARRCRATWNEQIDLRIPEDRRPAERLKFEAEVAPLVARPSFVPLPERFRHLPRTDVFDFTAEQSHNHRDQAKRVLDTEAGSGITNRLELSDEDLQRYRLPMPWGLYTPAEQRVVASRNIGPDDVPGPGYHWYKLGPAPVRTSSYVYFFWSWIVQFPVDSAAGREPPEREFDIWARVRFEGPAFPHGKQDDPNAISIERVVLVAAGAEP